MAVLRRVARADVAEEEKYSECGQKFVGITANSSLRWQFSSRHESLSKGRSRLLEGSCARWQSVPQWQSPVIASCILQCDSGRSMAPASSERPRRRRTPGLPWPVLPLF